MPRQAKRISANKMLEILNKQWLDTKDIKALASVGENRARDIKKEIAKELLQENYFLPTGLVPSEKAIQYLNLNVSYLRKVAKEMMICQNS